MSQSPEFFGKHILLEKLATGGMAEVYLAKTMGAENVSKFVAIKRILPQFSENQEFVDMFKEEAKIAINLNHSNVVSIFEFGEEKGQFFLVMEFVEGRNLRQIINRIQNTGQRLSIENIVYIINEVARGLDAAHRCLDGTTGKPLNITHRDISPQNVMISFEGETKIVDFGIAKAESKIENTQAGTLKGKFGYMSPEQAEGQEVDYRTDIFSLGIVLWELLAQERLFLSNNELNTLRKIRDCQIPSLRKIDPNIATELERITNKALTKDRNMRYQSAGDLHRDLNRFLNRQYPDFSSQDFSTYIKQLYAKEREEHRAKMIAYAKLQGNPNLNNNSSSQEKTQYIPKDAFTGTITETKSMAGENMDQKSDTNSFFKNLTPEELTKSRLNKLDLNMKVNPSTMVRGPDQSRNTNPSFGGVPANVRRGTASYGTSTRSNAGLPGYTATSYRSSGGSSFFSSLLTLLFFLGGSGTIGYLYLQKNPQQAELVITIIPQLKGILPQAEREVGGTSEATPTPPQAGPVSRLLVTSTPPGANILVNAKPVGAITNAQVDVPLNQEYTVTVERDGYLPYFERRTSREAADSINVKLVKADFGYVAIDVRPSDAQVYINERQLPGRAPFARVPIQAGVKVRVSAYNPNLKTYAEEIVTVKKDSQIKVDLFLKQLPGSQSAGQTPRTPSGN